MLQPGEEGERLRRGRCWRPPVALRLAEPAGVFVHGVGARGALRLVLAHRAPHHASVGEGLAAIAKAYGYDVTAREIYVQTNMLGAWWRARF